MSLTAPPPAPGHAAAPAGGWKAILPLIASLCAISFMEYGATLSSIGLFLKPVQTEFGGSMAQASSIASVFMLASCASSLVAGWLLDRLGAKSVVLAGCSASAIGLLVASRSGGMAGVFGGFALSGIGFGGATYVPTTAVLSRRLTSGLGTALGLTLAAAALGSAVLPMAMANLILLAGWRTTCAGAAAGILVVTLPLVVAIIPAGAASHPRHSALPGPARWTAREKRSLARACTAQFIFVAGYMGLYFHLMPCLAERGFAPATVAAIFGAMNIVSTIGLAVIGIVADRYGARRILLVSMIANGLSVLLLAIDNPAYGWIALVSFVIAWGVTQGAPTQLIPVLVATEVRTDKLGTASGLIGLIQGLAGAAGPLLIGYLHDLSNGYGEPIAVAACLALAATAPLLIGTAHRGSAKMPETT